MSPKSIPSSPEIDDVEDWNREDAAELQRPKSKEAYDVAINARDWTVGTIVQQISQGNIDLDPAFQRRNAWRDNRRSRLIESFILNFPVPQIVLAENPRRKRSYIVIDGRQRLMTIAGVFLPEYRDYWKTPELTGLEVLTDLNGKTLDWFLQSSIASQYRLQLDNADIRATVISGFQDEGILYDIFFRINTGSVPLSSQELRQVLNRGDFSRYLLETTSTPNAIWDLLGIDEPDARLRDVELLLRLIAWEEFARKYAGNMKKFLDDAMKELNANWTSKESGIKRVVVRIMNAVAAVRQVYGEHAGRKFKDGRYEGSFNRALFEVQALYMMEPGVQGALKKKSSAAKAAFQKLSGDTDFLASIESTTKSLDNTRTRFGMYARMLATTLKMQVRPIPIGKGE